MAGNVPEAVPAGIVTDAGTLNAAKLLETVIAAPPVGAADDKLIVQDEIPPVPRLSGAQAKELITAGPDDPGGGCEVGFAVTVPPVPVLDRAVPDGEEATVLLTFIGTLPAAFAASVTVITATVPFWIVVVFNPTIRQV